MGALNFPYRPRDALTPPLIARLLRAIQAWTKEALHPVTIDGTPADNEVLAWDSTLGRFVNQTGTEAGLLPHTAKAPYELFKAGSVLNAFDTSPATPYTITTTEQTCGAGIAVAAESGGQKVLVVGSVTYRVADLPGDVWVRPQITVEGNETILLGVGSFAAPTPTAGAVVISDAGHGHGNTFSVGRGSLFTGNDTHGHGGHVHAAPVHGHSVDLLNMVDSAGDTHNHPARASDNNAPADTGSATPTDNTHNHAMGGTPTIAGGVSSGTTGITASTSVTSVQDYVSHTIGFTWAGTITGSNVDFDFLVRRSSTGGGTVLLDKLMWVYQIYRDNT